MTTGVINGFYATHLIQSIFLSGLSLLFTFIFDPFKSPDDNRRVAWKDQQAKSRSQDHTKRG